MEMDPAQQPIGSSMANGSGDSELWRTTLSRVIPMIYGMFVRRGIHPSLAEELTQKSVFDAYRGRTEFDPSRGQVDAWIVGIARNNLALEMRKRKNSQAIGPDLMRHLAALDTAVLPDEALECDEMRILVRRAMNDLRDNERQVLHLRYLEDRTVPEIARQLKITDKAVHSLLYRAKISLRDKLIHLEPLLKEERRI
jgi:RNA polymerase sigma-70 factor (ECF subfamily)